MARKTRTTTAMEIPTAPASRILEVMADEDGASGADRDTPGAVCGTDAPEIQPWSIWRALETCSSAEMVLIGESGRGGLPATTSPCLCVVCHGWCFACGGVCRRRCCVLCVVLAMPPRKRRDSFGKIGKAAGAQYFGVQNEPFGSKFLEPSIWNSWNKKIGCIIRMTLYLFY